MFCLYEKNYSILSRNLYDSSLFCITCRNTYQLFFLEKYSNRIITYLLIGKLPKKMIVTVGSSTYIDIQLIIRYVRGRAQATQM